MRRRGDALNLTDVFAALIFGILAIYLFLGWAFIAALDRRIARHRSGWGLLFAIVVWPITIIVDLIGRHGPNQG